MSVIEIIDLHVEIEGKEILKGVNLTLNRRDCSYHGTKWNW